MGRVILYSLVMVCTVVVISALLPSNDAVVEKVEVNIGRVTPNSKTTKPFSVENNSAQTWQIKDIVTSCGCTDVTMGSQLIPPKTKVEGQLTVSAPSRPGQFGVIGKIRLVDADPIDIVIKAIVVSPLVIMPATLEITDSLKGTFKCVREDPDATVSVVSAPTWCDVRLENDLTGSVQINAAPDTGVDGNVVLKTSAGFLSTLRVSVKRNAFVSITPSVVHLGTVKVGSVCRRQIRVSLQGRNDSAAGWDVDWGHPQLDVSQRSENGTTILDIEFRPISSGLVSETLTLTRGPLTAKVPILARVVALANDAND